MDIGKIKVSMNVISKDLNIKINGFSFDEDFSVIFLFVSHFENFFNKKQNDFAKNLISSCESYAKKSLDGFTSNF